MFHINADEEAMGETLAFPTELPSPFHAHRLRILLLPLVSDVDSVALMHLRITAHLPPVSAVAGR